MARRIRAVYPSLGVTEANARAWAEGLRQLDDAIQRRRSYFFETTLGGRTITGRLEAALDAGLEVRVWYAGLASPELHIARVAARVRAGGHDIPEADIRRRYDASRRNLIRLLPRLTELKVYDNSAEVVPRRGAARPTLVLHCMAGRIVGPRRLDRTPEWAKPIVAAAVLRDRENAPGSRGGAP